MGLLFVKVYFERDERGNEDGDDAATRNISRARLAKNGEQEVAENFFTPVYSLLFMNDVERCNCSCYVTSRQEVGSTGVNCL